MFTPKPGLWPTNLISPRGSSSMVQFSNPQMQTYANWGWFQRVREPFWRFLDPWRTCFFNCWKHAKCIEAGSSGYLWSVKWLSNHRQSRLHPNLVFEGKENQIKQSRFITRICSRGPKKHLVALLKGPRAKAKTSGRTSRHLYHLLPLKLLWAKQTQGSGHPQSGFLSDLTPPQV